MAHQVEVLICGCGSAGLCAALWLARCGVQYRILEKRPWQLEIGQADGVQCRTVEIFESFGLAEELLRESYHVLEVGFWASDGQGGLARTSRTADTMPGLSHQPHVILNQARVNGLLIEAIQRIKGPEIDYGYDVTSVEVDESTADNLEIYPVKVVAAKDGKQDLFRARYVLVCVLRSENGDSSEHEVGL